MSNDEPGSDEPTTPRKQPAEKQIEKVKADNEKQIEKIKADNEKLPFEKQKLEKPEFKESKNELKEHKGEKEKPEKEKFEKHEKHEKLEKHDKPEIEKNPKEGKSEFEKSGAAEGPEHPFDPVILRKHAEALEESARQLRHFIDQGERPDLGGGALRDEPDQGGDG